MTTTTTTTNPRRGDLVTLHDGRLARILSTRGGYITTDLGTIDPQMIAPALAPAEAARSFLDRQTEAMRAWNHAAMPSRKELDAALGHIAALLGELGR